MPTKIPVEHFCTSRTRIAVLEGIRDFLKEHGYKPILVNDATSDMGITTGFSLGDKWLVLDHIGWRMDLSVVGDKVHFIIMFLGQGGPMVELSLLDPCCFDQLLEQLRLRWKKHDQLPKRS